MSCIVHIGLPRWASSFLQTAIFPVLEGVRYSHLPAVMLADKPFDSQRFLRRVELDDSAGPAVGLLSSEAVSFMEPRALENLQTAIPQARIIVIVRDQIDWMLSYYCHTVCNNHAVSGDLRTILSWHYEAWQDKLRYDLLADRCSDLFGTENVLLVPYELLRRDPDAFVSTICRFIGCPVSQYATAPVIISQRSLALLRSNRLLNVVHGPINNGDDIRQCRYSTAA